MVGRLRNNLIAHRGIDIRHSPFLFSTVADMKELQFLGQYKIMRPYSWSVVEVMSTFLEEALNGMSVLVLCISIFLCCLSYVRVLLSLEDLMIES